jgi:hypothetical protein
MFRDETTGYVELDVHQLDNSADFALADTCRYVVPQRVKRVIESALSPHVLFRPALLSDPLARLENRPKSVSWEAWGPPWWELTSDYTLPAVSPSMDLRDPKGSPLAPGDPTASYHRYEGLHIWPELHYRAADLRTVEPFGLARTLEHFGGDIPSDDRTLVASRDFYDLCVRHGLKAEWLPVRIEVD